MVVKKTEIEKPIIFSGEMVRAILNGRKTQTRRVVKFPETNRPPSFPDKFNGESYINNSPFKVGQKLWVRETWAYAADAGHDEGGILYRATDPGWDDDRTGLRWRSPIHMPRWASRITLEVTAVRVERLQEISDEDIDAEGVSIEEGFINAWNRINGKKYPWSSNPWVWVIEFRKL